MHAISHDQFTAALDSIDPSLGAILIAEAAHRTLNELAGAIAALAHAKRRCPDRTAISILDETSARLHAYADLQRLLSPPGLAQGRAGDDLRLLCTALSAARLKPAGIDLRLTYEPIVLTLRQTWLLNLVVSELVTNAARHAFDDDGGCITVHVTANWGEVMCSVSDDGCGAGERVPGTGSRILDVLLTCLNGAWDLRSTASGTSAVVRFPLCPQTAEASASP